MKKKKSEEISEEYYFLTRELDETNYALKGSCDDIGCDKFIYKDLLKKKYKPVLKHSFSCIKSLKAKKDSILRILSQKRYKKYRYIPCFTCKKELDKLSDKNTIISFTKPSKTNNNFGEMVKWSGEWIHNSCSKKTKIPKDWTTI